MSYARFGTESDVYVYPTGAAACAVPRSIICDNCALLDGNLFAAPSHAIMLAHLHEHRAAGHRVPEYVFARLLAEMIEGER